MSRMYSKTSLNKIVEQIAKSVKKKWIIKHRGI